MNPNYTYFLILAASFAGPLALSFDKKVSFYKSWKYVFAAMAFPALIYIAWDCWFTAIEIWKFNPEFITGTYIFNLPLEEALFFIIVPFCCLFIYECIRVYFPKISKQKKGWNIFFALSVILLILAFYFNDRAYPFSTFIFLSFSLSLIYAFRKRLGFFKPVLFLVSYIVILIPFLIVNGLLTSLPVVIYNNAENMDLRIYTIPVEDIFYGMLLFLLNVLIFEKLRSSKFEV